MFGTLIICLPSEHTGGAVCLRHGSKSERFDSSGSSAFGASYLTWFVPSAISNPYTHTHRVTGTQMSFTRYANLSVSISELDLDLILTD